MMPFVSAIANELVVWPTNARLDEAARLTRSLPAPDIGLHHRVIIRQVRFYVHLLVLKQLAELRRNRIRISIWKWIVGNVERDNF